jgi:hypothetical protein
MRRYFNNGYIQLAVGFFLGILGPAVGGLLDGRPIINGPLTAIVYAVLLILCLVLGLIGIRKTRRGS